MSNARKFLIAAGLFLAGYLTMNVSRCGRAPDGAQVERPAR